MEIVNRDALEQLMNLDLENSDKEHITTYIQRNPQSFKHLKLQPPQIFQTDKLKINIDTKNEYDFMKKSIEAVYKPGELLTLTGFLDSIKQN